MITQKRSKGGPYLTQQTPLRDRSGVRVGLVNCSVLGWHLHAPMPRSGEASPARRCAIVNRAAEPSGVHRSGLDRRPEAA